MNTSEKKCEACKTVPHNGHNTDMSCCRHTCQKEQPSIDTVFICQKCRNKKDRWKPGAIVPYCVCEEPTPPQELRQEGWEKEFCSEFCQLGPEGHTWDWAIEAGYIECMDNDNNSYTKLKSFIKKIEQKARKEERKRCAEIVDDFKGFHGLTYSQTCELQQKILNTRNND